MYVMMSCPKQRINLDEPRYDQETYTGRARHFFSNGQPFKSVRNWQNARGSKICNEPLPIDVTEDQLWRAKVLYDSAFHPDTGEKMNIIGRMSAQVPMNVLITGGMIIFYKSTPAVVFWQWLNQSFNALVNYTNRSGDIQQTNKQLLTSYLCATGGAVGTALTLNSLVKKMPPIVGRMVPFAAVAAANCINIPLMRAQELRHGTPIFDEQNNKLGYSKAAAQSGIGQNMYGATRNGYNANCDGLFRKRGTLCRYPWLTVPASLGILGLCLTFATPLACALFKQKASMPYKHLEPELREEIEKKWDIVPTQVYFNKGL
ncbi:hypothetical protein NQ318_008048 [Aromia moschata]|uniref:Sidoreflexin n=1 Tax=Aromia moschata TaxID=1265417 RepID=A0AAV8X318_9CUCU|nr:hypothetical protein NQ318_008048 [Aromia moschata]